MAMEEYNEIMKEIRNLAREIPEMKGKMDAFVTMREDIKEANKVACRADNNATQAQERLDKIDKYTSAMWIAIFTALVG